MRIGFGYDIHPLVEGRPLILGGVTVPFDKGLAGHSDADVVAHAVADALLGAAGLGDIGEHFPDTDQNYKNISSLLLLKEVERKLGFEKLKIVNIDITLVLQKPRISAYKKEMIRNLAASLFLTPDQVNIKATTAEFLGFIGKGEGAVCYAVALLEPK
jgi:2-C-methyl-D-erythritol 2,4-cyclodiphosphate synthase